MKKENTYTGDEFMGLRGFCQKPTLVFHPAEGQLIGKMVDWQVLTSKSFIQNKLRLRY